jgi:hypothetical protein
LCNSVINDIKKLIKFPVTKVNNLKNVRDIKKFAETFNELLLDAHGEMNKEGLDDQNDQNLSPECQY